MQTRHVYDSIMPNQNVFISAGNNKIDINDNNFYCVIRDCYNKLNNSDNTELINSLSTQSNICMIQKTYLELAETNQDIVISGIKVKFANDIWDFTSKCKAGKKLYLYTYNFKSNSKLSDYQKTILKLYALYNITEYGLHSSSNKSKFSEALKIMNYMNDKNIILIESLTLKDLKDYLELVSGKYKTKVNHKRFIKEFIVFYSLIATDIITKEMNKWFNDIDTDVINAIIEENKTKLLPSSFYKKYTTLLYEAIIDTKTDKFKRGYYGLLYIGTQTGLRSAELTLLRVHDLVIQEVKEVMELKNKKVGILHYRSTKSGNPKGDIYDNGKTIANKKVIEVYEILEKLFNEERKALNVDYLVPRDTKAAPNKENKAKRYYIITKTLIRENRIFCLEHAKELDIINSPESDSFESKIKYNEKKALEIIPKRYNDAGVKKGDVVCFPIIRQFRVYVASELRERGVDDRTTAYLFNHHCVEMYGYYARPKHEIQEDIDFSKEIVKDIVKDETKILGSKGEAFTEKINQIIEDNNLNVEKDLDAIIDKVCEEVPIRAKNGGFCIKSNPRRQCRHDAATDEFMCAYGCCPNHCHMYFMLGVTYEKVHTLIKTYEYNLNAGFKNASEKEAYKLNYAIVNELLPEIEETKNEIQLRGSEWIVQAHPEMEDIINNLDEIEQEALEWKKKLEKPNYQN